MLSRVRFIRMNGDELSIALRDQSNGYSLLDVDGLDPVPATLSSTPYAHRDGAHFHNSRREPRDLKFRLGLEASPVVGTVRSLRTALYKYLMPGNKIQIRLIMDDGGSYTIWGEVEDFDAPIFVADAEAVISIRCFNPDFVSTGWTNRAINSTSGSSPNHVTYVGNVPTGFILSGPITRPISAVRVRNTHPDVGIRTMSIEYDFLEGDHLTVNTNPGERGVLVKRDGQTKSIMKAWGNTSEWWMLHEGVNVVLFQEPGSPSISLNMGYNAKFGGL